MEQERKKLRYKLINYDFCPNERARAEKIEWDILNPDRLINLEINNKRRTSII